MSAPDDVMSRAVEAAAAAASEHELTTTTTNRRGINTHHAGCTCGESFDWSSRETEHSLHIRRVWLAAALPVVLAALAERIKARYETDPSNGWGAGMQVAEEIVRTFAAEVAQ